MELNSTPLPFGHLSNHPIGFAATPPRRGMEENYQVVTSETVYNGKIVDIVHDTITLPDGRTALREIVKHADGAAVLPIDNDGNIIFIRQYRHPVGEMVLEIPAGTLDEGENHLNCAARELEEEIGYTSSNIRFLSRICPSVGFCDENIYIYLATDLVKSKQNLDADEFIELEVYTPTEALRMISDGTIYDAKTVTAILTYCLQLQS